MFFFKDVPYPFQIIGDKYKSYISFRSCFGSFCRNVIKPPLSFDGAIWMFDYWEGEALAALHPQIVVKLPLIENGIKGCKYFSDKGIEE